MTVELDPQLAELLRLGAASGSPPAEALEPAEVRANFAALAALQLGVVAEMHAVEDRDADGVRVRIYHPVATAPPTAGLVYFHGGGWVIGDLDTHDGLVRALARGIGCVIVSVDYRLAPEHPYPAALDDAWTAARWVQRSAGELGLDPARLGVGGDSAGGTLAALVARRGRDAGTPFAAQLLLYPVASARADSESWSLFADGYGLTSAGMTWFWRHYLGSISMADAAGDPDLSPLALQDPSGLPPAVVITAEADILRDEGEAYAALLAAAGVETCVRRWPRMNHGFARIRGIVDEARVAVDEIADLVAPLLRGAR